MMRSNALAGPEATASVLDRPAVLTVAAEFLAEFARSGREGAAGVPKRVRLLPGNIGTHSRHMRIRKR